MFTEFVTAVNRTLINSVLIVKINLKWLKRFTFIVIVSFDIQDD